MSTEEQVPDYTAMEAPTMLAALRDDASKWAAAFCQTAKKLGYGDIDEGWMTGWFANAIEHSTDVRVGGDGSAWTIS
jgi:hypothetical protein